VFFRAHLGSAYMYEEHILYVRFLGVGYGGKIAPIPITNAKRTMSSHLWNQQIWLALLATIQLGIKGRAGWQRVCENTYINICLRLPKTHAGRPVLLVQVIKSDP
jgi:hypothetical protein